MSFINTTLKLKIYVRQVLHNTCSAIDERKIWFAVSFALAFDHLTSILSIGNIVWCWLYGLEGGVRSRERVKGHRSWGVGGPDPLKDVGGVRVCSDPLNVTFFHSKLLLDNSPSFMSSWRMKDLCQKWKVKLIFRSAWNSLMVWFDWHRPPCFTIHLRHCRNTKDLLDWQHGMAITRGRGRWSALINPEATTTKWHVT